MTTIQKKCKCCKKTFGASLPEHNRGYAKFCSRKCAGAYHSAISKKRKPKTNSVCAQCNKRFYRSPSKREKSKSGLLFCSRACKDAAQRIGGIKEIMPKHYGEGRSARVARDRAFRFFGKACQRCGYRKCASALIVHHKNKDRSDNTRKNLEVLCRNCHAEAHVKKHGNCY